MHDFFLPRNSAIFINPRSVLILVTGKDVLHKFRKLKKDKYFRARHVLMFIRAHKVHLEDNAYNVLFLDNGWRPLSNSKVNDS